MLGPEHRQVGQALDAEPARKPTLHRGYRQSGGHERKGQRHSDRALAFALADGERLDGLGGIDAPLSLLIASVIVAIIAITLESVC